MAIESITEQACSHASAYYNNTRITEIKTKTFPNLTRCQSNLFELFHQSGVRVNYSGYFTTQTLQWRMMNHPVGNGSKQKPADGGSSLAPEDNNIKFPFFSNFAYFISRISLDDNAIPFNIFLIQARMHFFETMFRYPLHAINTLRSGVIIIPAAGRIPLSPRVWSASHAILLQ